MGPIFTIIFRIIQLVFSIIVLALSIKLIKGQNYGGSPATTSYAAFVGGLGIVVAVFGVLSQILAALRDSIIIAIVDLLASLFFLAGGVAMAVALGPGVNSCNNKLYRENNKIIDGGLTGPDHDLFFGPTPLKSRCEMAQATAAFEFLGLVAFLASAILMFLASRKKVAY